MTNEPLNNNTVKFYLDFTQSIGRVEIAEPIGWDGTLLTLKQDEQRLGRDVFFGETDFIFNIGIEINGLTHRYEDLIDSYKNNGFESKIFFILNIDNIDYIIGELDFATANTDLFSFIACKIIQETAQVNIKRREDVSVNVFSDKNVEDEDIIPIETSQMLLRATPERQNSKWESYSTYTNTHTVFGTLYHNPAFVLVNNKIEESLSPESFSANPNNLSIVDASNSLSNVKIKISTTDLSMNFSGIFQVNLVLTIAVGLDANNPTQIFTPFVEIIPTFNSYNMPDSSWEVDIPNVLRDEKIFVYWEVKSTPSGGGVQRTTFNVGTMNVEMDVESLSISSTTIVTRFIDTFRQVVKSISEMTVIAPRFDVGGEYYNQWLTTGKLLRQITDDGFNVSLKELLNHLRNEIHGDYQIIDDNTIFLGIYEDFYTDIEIGYFPMLPNSVFSEKFSENYMINKINLKFKNYEKEDDEDKSRNSVHTEIDILLPNKSVENTKVIDIEFVRDGFLIEKTRKDAIKISDDTATKDDNEIYILESTEKELHFDENIFVNQVSTGIENELLVLINDDSFNWELLGIREHTIEPLVTDIITITGSNAGDWIVVEFTPNTITLSPIGSTVDIPIVEGIEIVKFSYDVTSTNLTQRIGEGFVDLGDIFLTNGAWSNKRIIRNYWGNYLKACTLFRAGQKYIVTRYVHNRTWESGEINQFIVVEDDFITTPSIAPPLVMPINVETEVIADFSEYWELLGNIKSQRGYIIVTNNKGDDIKIFPNSVTYDWANNIINIIGLKKYN